MHLYANIPYKELTRIAEIQKGVLPKFCILIRIFCFQSNLDQTWSDCSTHENCNLTKIGQNWTENKNFLSVCKILTRPFLKLCWFQVMNLSFLTQYNYELVYFCSCCKGQVFAQSLLVVLTLPDFFILSQVPFIPSHLCSLLP